MFRGQKIISFPIRKPLPELLTREYYEVILYEATFLVNNIYFRQTDAQLFPGIHPQTVPSTAPKRAFFFDLQSRKIIELCTNRVSSQEWLKTLLYIHLFFLTIKFSMKSWGIMLLKDYRTELFSHTIWINPHSLACSCH